MSLGMSVLQSVHASDLQHETQTVASITCSCSICSCCEKDPGTSFNGANRISNRYNRQLWPIISVITAAFP